MTFSKDKAGAFAFLALALAYGLNIGDIPMLPGDEDEPFNAKTMPIFLSWMTGIVSFLLLVMPSRNETGGEPVIAAFKGLQWRKTFQLLGLMLLYGLALTYLGFIPATILFIASGLWILNERRLKYLIFSSIPLTVAFWYILSQLLGIYLTHGEIFYLLGGAQ
ncbi:MAG: tricarboxylic transport TctB [Sulfitobacter sp.]|nr:MAG: tricarboxylic transport TctB [Sulfitobacter sp.]